MSYFSNIGKRLGAVLAGLCLSVLAPSCIEDYGECPVVGGEGPFHLSFTIVTKNVPGSRAADISGDEPGTAPENYLDVKDVRILIFDDAQSFIADVTPSASIVAAYDNFTIYNVTARFDDPYFVDKVNSATNTSLDFYIFVLANYSNWRITLPPLQKGLALSDLFTQTGAMTVLPNTDKLLNAVSGTGEYQLFPMAGLQKFSINPKNLLDTSEGAPFNLSLGPEGKDVNLLRALTKIEVVDKIGIADNAQFTDADKADAQRIAAVELDGYMNRGTLIPDMGQWNRNGTFETRQVVAPSVPTGAEYALPPVLNADNTFGSSAGLSNYAVALALDERATNLRTDKCPVWSCYVFEYSQEAIPTVDATQQPYVRVTTKGDENSNPTVPSLTLPMRLADYSQNPPVNVPYLLRNHIYRYEIVGINQKIELNWTVCPMDVAQGGITFN